MVPEILTGTRRQGRRWVSSRAGPWVAAEGTSGESEGCWLYQRVGHSPLGVFHGATLPAPGTTCPPLGAPERATSPTLPHCWRASPQEDCVAAAAETGGAGCCSRGPAGRTKFAGPFQTHPPAPAKLNYNLQLLVWVNDE